VSIKPNEAKSMPEDTVRVARAVFPKGNRYMRLRDELGELYTDEMFARLFPVRGQPGESPGCLALVTVMQFMEGLSDRQAAEAVRARIDWKYALGLGLTDAGFDYSVLSEFRARLVAGHAEQQILDELLGVLKARGLLKARGRQRTDSTHVLASIRVLNRLECVGETLRQALNTLAAEAPDWLRSWVPTVWFDRYERRFEEYRLPTNREERYALAEQIGADGFHLLEAVYETAHSTDSGVSGVPVSAGLWGLPAVQVLRRVWVQQFFRTDGGDVEWSVRWRSAEDLPPGALLISSPYDEEARYCKKRTTEWTGYKVHLTETCEADRPNLITDVQTTPATTSDRVMTAVIQDHLAERELLPAEHLVDVGYVSAEHLLNSQTQHQVDLLAPAPHDPSWQAKANQGFDIRHFSIDWDAQTVTCPARRQSAYWTPGKDRLGLDVIDVCFAHADCQTCTMRAQCTRSSKSARTLSIRTRPLFEALHAARQRQTTPEFKKRYAARSGVEGTFSQTNRVADLRHARYIGLAKTHLQHIITAAATNVLRLVAWLEDVPRALTRRSAFARLALTPV
jgi:transposase